MGSQRDLGPYGSLPDFKEDPERARRAVQGQLDELWFLVKRGMVQAKNSGGLYLAVSPPNVPTVNIQQGRMEFNSSTNGGADVARIYDGGWKRVGTPAPLRSYDYGPFTKALPWAGFAEVSSLIRIVYTPDQKIFFKADGLAQYSAGPADATTFQIGVTPAPAGFYAEQVTEHANNANSTGFGSFSAMGTLTAGIAYTFTINHANSNAGPGNVEVSSLNLYITFHHPA